MCEIPWQNVALWLLMRAAQQHPDWQQWDCAAVAADAEQHAQERGAAAVEQRDVTWSVETYELAHALKLTDGG